MPTGTLAGWWYRVGASVIDGIPFGILDLVGVTTRTVALTVLAGIAGMLYQVLMIGANGGRTVGNMVVGTRVADAATGAPPTWGKAVLRWVGQILFDGLGSFIIFLGPVLDFLWPLWDPQNQTLHDKVASTVVLRV